ncbi:hypothetical protein FQN54_009419 [Arachnomyces sp. PD_36]|nr:hypothetical protein FQN54_009419 [Arachnomyces sp. PD_36]
MASPARYQIVKRTAGIGTVPPQEPNTHEYTYVASALDIALSMLSAARVKESMVLLARIFDQNLPAQERTFEGAPDMAITTRVNQFVGIVQGQAPLIVLDGHLAGSTVRAYHPRGEWSGTFIPRSQSVHINQQVVELVDDMVNASNTPGEFRRFQFQFANLFFHEIGAHLLFTYLYQGRPITPPQIIPQNWVEQPQPGNNAETAGESGRVLETMAFEGTIEFFNTPQVSTAWIVNDSGFAKKVTAQAVDATVIYRNFILPYPTANPAKDVQSLVASEGRQTLARTAGPQERHFIDRALARPIPFHISSADLRHVPNNPSILAQPA